VHRAGVRSPGSGGGQDGARDADRDRLAIRDVRVEHDVDTHQHDIGDRSIVRMRLQQIREQCVVCGHRGSSYRIRGREFSRGHHNQTCFGRLQSNHHCLLCGTEKKNMVVEADVALAPALIYADASIKAEGRASGQLEVCAGKRSRCRPSIYGAELWIHAARLTLLTAE
jgi:hypothetical protein